jgi:peptide/nickel transport system permease protein
MNEWQRLRSNPLAWISAVILAILYLAAIGADFLAPYNPYDALKDSSVLPPTTIDWSQGGVVYPTTQGVIDLETGERQLIIDYSQPARLQILHPGWSYNFLEVKLPLPQQDGSWAEVTIFPGIPSNLHLFVTTNDRARLYLLGTDTQGRDQFSRLLFGARISLSIGLVGTVIAFSIGAIVGGIAGYVGGAVDSVLMRLVEVLMSVPTIYLLISLSAILPPQMSNSQRFLLITAITSLLSWAGLARVVRGQVLAIKNQDFVLCARAMGASSLHIIGRHILPQTFTYLIIAATATIPSFILTESALSLVGLGIQPPDPSWGNMLSISTNASVIVLQPWLIWSPVTLIIVTVLSFNILGDSLRDAFDPRQ